MNTKRFISDAVFNDVAVFLSKLSQLDLNYGQKKGGKNLSLNKLLEK
jgi:hypothetical protein